MASPAIHIFAQQVQRGSVVMHGPFEQALRLLLRREPAEIRIGIAFLGARNLDSRNRVRRSLRLSFTIPCGGRQRPARGLKSSHERDPADRHEHTREAHCATEPARSYLRARLVARTFLILPLVHSLGLRHLRAHENRRLLEAKVRVESSWRYGTAGQIAANYAIT